MAVMKKIYTALAAVLLLAAPSAAQQAEAPFVVQETGEAYGSLQEAVSAIGSGSGSILIAPGTYRQCAVQEEGSVAYRAQQAGTVIFDRTTCEGKAALVLRGAGARVEGLVFQNIAVPDGNGAGIRLEAGNLTVRESLFRDSQQGILSGNDPAGAIRIEQSTFSGLGLCADDCAHSVYIGGYGSLSISRSRFERGTGGHYVKTRSPRVEITDSSFDDSQGRSTNYMIDLSNGATGRIARNVFVQGRDKENYSAMIMVAPEGAENGSDGLTITDNEASLVPGLDRRTAFVADGSGAAIRIDNNRLGPQIAQLERR
jgi:hypothetical protein